MSWSEISWSFFWVLGYELCQKCIHLVGFLGFFYNSWSEMSKFGRFSGDKISKKCSIYIVNYTISLLFYQTNNAHTISNFKTKIKNHIHQNSVRHNLKANKHSYIYKFFQQNNWNHANIRYNWIRKVISLVSVNKTNILTKSTSLPIMHLAR